MAVPSSRPAPTQPRPLQLQAWRAFLEVHSRVTERLDTDLRVALDLPLTWYDVLVQLSEAGGRLRMSELADAVLLSRSNCTRLVDRMVDAGLVERRNDPTDARVRWAVLTPAGDARLHQAAPEHLAGVEELFTSQLDDESAEVLLAAFTAMLAAEARRPE